MKLLFLLFIMTLPLPMYPIVGRAHVSPKWEEELPDRIKRRLAKKKAGMLRWQK